MVSSLIGNRIFLSVDLDEWYQCRWATGHKNSKWHDLNSCFREYYHQEKPIGEIIDLTKKIINLFNKYEANATFFITGDIALFYPELLEMLIDNGFEIGLHNMHHKDYDSENFSEFKEDIHKSKRLIEGITKQKIIGYRSPNSVVSNLHIKELIKQNIKYDSSITPTRSIFGKFGKFSHLPVNPYRLSIDSYDPGNSDLWEFPWPVFPKLNLPSGSGITTRMFGKLYLTTSLQNALKTGNSAFYFHPYEIGEPPKIKSYGSFFDHYQMIRIGNWFHKTLQGILKKYKGQFISGIENLEQINSQ